MDDGVNKRQLVERRDMDFTKTDKGSRAQRKKFPFNLQCSMDEYMLSEALSKHFGYCKRERKKM